MNKALEHELHKSRREFTPESALAYVKQTPSLKSNSYESAVVLTIMIDDMVASTPDVFLPHMGPIYRYNLESITRTQVMSNSHSETEHDLLEAMSRMMHALIEPGETRIERYREMVHLIPNNDQQAYFNSCLGEFAKHAFQKNNKKEWAYRWYSRKKRAAKLLGHIDSRHAAGNYASAATAANHIYVFARDEVWLQRAINHLERHNSHLGNFKSPRIKQIVREKEIRIQDIKDRLAKTTSLKTKGNPIII